MVLGVRVVGTVFDSWTRGRSIVASVHAVGEVEMKTSKCEIERSIAKDLEIKNRYCTYGAKLTGERVHSYVEAGRTQVFYVSSHMSLHMPVGRVMCMTNGSQSTNIGCNNTKPIFAQGRFRG